jgi:hypothetical protein
VSAERTNENDRIIAVLAEGLQQHDPEPYYPGGWEDVAYYREYAASLLPTIERIVRLSTSPEKRES